MRLRFWWLGFLLGIFTPLFLGIFFHFANFVFADTTSTSITVNATVSAGPAPVCGNGIVESGEVCDDGNTTSGDGCSATCQLESVCGNGAVESGEQCDDGNHNNTDACTNTCRIGVCGDGVAQIWEQCDDGNRVDTDACSNSCKSPASLPMS
jgi:cysteine-rich repeat protein